MTEILVFLVGNPLDAGFLDVKRLLPLEENEMSPVGCEAKCLKCGEIVVNPGDDLIHYEREDGTECGGDVEIIGAWG